MSRRMKEDAETIFRVRVSTHWHGRGDRNRTTVDYLGPYSTRAIAQGEATKARRGAWSGVTVSTRLEMAMTAWGAASEEEESLTHEED